VAQLAAFAANASSFQDFTATRLSTLTADLVVAADTQSATATLLAAEAIKVEVLQNASSATESKTADIISRANAADTKTASLINRMNEIEVAIAEGADSIVNLEAFEDSTTESIAKTKAFEENVTAFIEETKAAASGGVHIGDINARNFDVMTELPDSFNELTYVFGP
jgi:imidazolonepropionase-like amidohydrolase